jgi:hypothetical protein
MSTTTGTQQRSHAKDRKLGALRRFDMILFSVAAIMLLQQQPAGSSTL